MSKYKVTEVHCDAPTCLTRYVVDKDEPYPIGYTFLKGVVIHGGGEPIPEFYACTEEHIVPAMRHVLDYQNGRG